MPTLELVLEAESEPNDGYTEPNVVDGLSSHGVVVGAGAFEYTEVQVVTVMVVVKVVDALHTSSCLLAT